jgi:serine/threonine-protein kinase haspin
MSLILAVVGPTAYPMRQNLSTRLDPLHRQLPRSQHTSSTNPQYPRMPIRKQVYGKRPRKAPTFASSSLFTWSSSPDRPTDSNGIATDTQDDVQKITARLQTTKLEATPKRQISTSNVKRGPLEKVDANVRVALESRPILKSREESTTTQKQKDDEPRKNNSKTKCASPDICGEPVPKKPAPKRTTRKTKSQPITEHVEASTPAPEEKPVRSTRRQTRRQKEEDTAPKDQPNLYADYTRPLLSLCGDDSARGSPTSFSSWTTSLEKYFQISKIAEASYGEVYRLSLQAPRPGFSRADESVLKIIALKPAPNAPSTSQRKAKAQISQMSSVANVVSEVQLLQRMTSTPGFTNFREIRVLQGRPCGAFVKAWKDFNNAQKKGEKSYFPDPSRKTSYDDTQLWAVIEMQDAGIDLEHFQINNIWSCWDIFWGVALSLGKGEEEAQFEVSGEALTRVSYFALYSR